VSCHPLRKSFHSLLWDVIRKKSWCDISAFANRIKQLGDREFQALRE
jgi:hypothetical protein